ncbi:hypothetical protein BJV82DRAFT_671352 [Fennellomyces sp. T-0311]|nr:hypothetical protein BJV82DRAFT_671352 [Fennellomyces sp. T-0311]
MSFRPPKTLPILSIFHNGNLPKSRAALELLKKRAAQSNGSDAYRVNVIETEPPTLDQLRQVASSLPKREGTSAWHQMVRPDAGVQDWAEIAQRIHDDPNLLQRPIVMDWARGQAAMTLDDIEKLINERIQSSE